MPEYDITNASYSDVANNIEDFSVDSQTLDSPTDDKETAYINTDWDKQLGYYKEIPELQVAIDAKATWTVGKGFLADEKTTLILDSSVIPTFLFLAIDNKSSCSGSRFKSFKVMVSTAIASEPAINIPVFFKLESL